MFYPAEPGACRAAAERFIRTPHALPAPTEGFGEVHGGIVPHAGWVCSGAIAGQTIGALAAARAHVDVVIVFGAVHTPGDLDVAALSSHDTWREPSEDSVVAEEIEAKLSERGGALFVTDDRFHENEHAVEVELPLIQAAWPGVRIVPIEVPLVDDAETIGRQAAAAVMQTGLSAVYLASSDLTHYGPAYGFTPVGVGESGLAWAKDNDRRVLELVTGLAVQRVVPDVRARMNACGGGAIAAMMAACREAGSTRASVLNHASSYETLRTVAPQPPTNAVGYASVILGR
jgi:AmmeMemoRadiSam system protein B